MQQQLFSNPVIWRSPNQLFACQYQLMRCQNKTSANFVHSKCRPNASDTRHIASSGAVRGWAETRDRLCVTVYAGGIWWQTLCWCSNILAVRQMIHDYNSLLSHCPAHSAVRTLCSSTWAKFSAMFRWFVVKILVIHYSTNLLDR